MLPSGPARLEFGCRVVFSILLLASIPFFPSRTIVPPLFSSGSPTPSMLHDKIRYPFPWKRAEMGRRRYLRDCIASDTAKGRVSTKRHAGRNTLLIPSGSALPFSPPTNILIPPLSLYLLPLQPQTHTLAYHVRPRRQRDEGELRQDRHIYEPGRDALVVRPDASPLSLDLPRWHRASLFVAHVPTSFTEH